MERVILIADYHQRKNNNHIFYDKKLSIDTHCNVPWDTLIVNRHGDSYICQSPAWLPKSIGSIIDVDDIYDLLNSHEALLIREEILKGRYFYCNSNLCGPFFSKINRSKFAQSAGDDQNSLVPVSVFSEDAKINSLPKSIIFDFDYTCNFVCPSCRTELINNNKDSFAKDNDIIVRKIKNLLIDKINKRTVIRWAGGEPFISKAYLDIWEYIISLKNINIRNIIQTNGSYLKKKEEILLNFLPYIDIIRISFDAGSSNTYTKLRVNGDWKTLLANSSWTKSVITTTGATTKLMADFVVQRDNYLEIPNYISICKSIGFDYININKMWNWGTWTDSEFANNNVSDKLHPDYNQFLEIIRQPQIQNDKTINIGAWANDL